MIRKFKFHLIILLLCSFQCTLADTVQVKLRNGAVLSGNIVSLNPTSELVLDIAGFETTIKMSDIENIESIKVTADDNPQTLKPKPASLIKTNPGVHPVVTYSGSIQVDKKGNKRIEVPNESGQTLIMDYASKDDKTLNVLGAKEKYKIYKDDKLIIPEYVNIDDEIFQVVSINSKAFSAPFAADDIYFKLKEIILPSTLKAIGDEAFLGISSLQYIIIPDSVEEIGKVAFRRCGSRNKLFEQLYIPATVKTIGENAFRNVGKKTSPRGYFQGLLTSIPSFITPINCTTYGIDDNAVEEYYNLNGVN